jgi:hypothetical protein
MFTLALFFYLISFVLLIFSFLFVFRKQRIWWFLSLLIAQALLVANVQLFASYTLYGQDVYVEYDVITSTLRDGKINFQNAFGAALYNSVLIPIVCMVSGIKPLIFYKATYTFSFMLHVLMVYLMLKRLRENDIKLKLSLTYAIFLFLPSITFSSMRFGIGLISYLALLLLIIRVIAMRRASYLEFLTIILMASSITVCYYTLGLNSLALLLLLCFMLIFFRNMNDALKKAFLLSTVIALISSFLYIFYLSLVLRQHILSTIYVLLRYSLITEERIEYVIGRQEFSYYIKTLVKIFPHVISLLGVILELFMLALKKIGTRSEVTFTKNDGMILIWLILGLVLTTATTFIRTGFAYVISVFSPLFTLGMYNIYSYFTLLPTAKIRKLLTSVLIAVLLVTQFLGSTYLIDTLLKLDTSSPVLDKTSVYRGISSTEFSDYHMLRFLLINIPRDKLTDLYSDIKIGNSIISVASDLYSEVLPYESTSININPYALAVFLKNKNIKGILILSSYSILTGRVIVPQGIIDIHLNDILGNYNLVYNGFSLILLRD